MELNQNQLLILEGKICPYCKEKTKFVDSKVIYKTKSFGMIYLCEPCNAYVGTHKGTEKSLGRLANKNLRHLKKEAHKYFDVIWKEKHEERNKVYYYLSLYLKIPQEQSDEIFSADEDHYNLQIAAEKTGIYEKLEKASKGYYALSPRWKDKEKKEILFWLNPHDQRDYESGWYGVKELEQWIKNEGPIIKVKK